jgi:hypothetical protein
MILTIVYRLSHYSKMQTLSWTTIHSGTCEGESPPMWWKHRMLTPFSNYKIPLISAPRVSKGLEMNRYSYIPLDSELFKKHVVPYPCIHHCALNFLHSSKLLGGCGHMFTVCGRKLRRSLTTSSPLWIGTKPTRRTLSDGTWKSTGLVSISYHIYLIY